MPFWPTSPKLARQIDPEGLEGLILTDGTSITSLSGGSPGDVVRVGGGGFEVAQLVDPTGSEAGWIVARDSAGNLIFIDPSTLGGGAGMHVPSEAWGSGSDGAVVYSTDTTVTSDINATTIVVAHGATVTIGWDSSEGRPAYVRATESIRVLGAIRSDGSPGEHGYDAPWSEATAAGGNSLSGGGGGGGGRNGQPGGAGGTSARPGANGSPGSDDGSSSSGGEVPDVLYFAGLQSWDEAISFGSGGVGGGGGGSQGSFGGGGGGGGGGVVSLFAPIISGSGQISARGGNGGNVWQSENARPGGGGGGGQIRLLARSIDLLRLQLSVIAGMPGDGGSLAPAASTGPPGLVVVATEVVPGDAPIDFFIPVVPL